MPEIVYMPGGGARAGLRPAEPRSWIKESLLSFIQLLGCILAPLWRRNGARRIVYFKAFQALIGPPARN